MSTRFSLLKHSIQKYNCFRHRKDGGVLQQDTERFLGSHQLQSWQRERGNTIINQPIIVQGDVRAWPTFDYQEVVTESWRLHYTTWRCIYVIYRPRTKPPAIWCFEKAFKIQAQEHWSWALAMQQNFISLPPSALVISSTSSSSLLFCLRLSSPCLHLILVHSFSRLFSLKCFFIQRHPLHLSVSGAHFFQVNVSFVLSLSPSLLLSLSLSRCVSFAESTPAKDIAVCRRRHAQTTLVAVREKLLQLVCVRVCGRSLLKDPCSSRAAMLNLQRSSFASTAISPFLLRLPLLSLHHPLTPFFLTLCPSLLSTRTQSSPLNHCHSRRPPTHMLCC